MSRAVLLLSSTRLTLLGLLAGLLLSATSLRAQVKQPSGGEDAKIMLPVEGAKRLDDQYKTKEVREALTSLTRGTTQPSDANREAIEVGAKWLIYRVTWPELQNKPEAMDSVVKEYDRFLTEIQRGKGTEKFLQQFSRLSQSCLRQVLQNDRAIARVNGARILARLAGTGQEEILDLLVEVLKDPKQGDAVKLWTLRGFQEFFKLTRGPDAIRVRDEERERRSIQAVLDFVNRKSDVSDSASPGEVAAFQYVRRDAVKALAETRHPAVVGKDKKLNPEAMTALTLLKILRKDGPAPEPTLAEQVEAAIGIAQLNADLLADYQADYAAAQVGRFLVEFTQQCLENREAKREPWKVYNLRLAQAMEEFKNNVRRTPYSDYVNKLAAQTRPIFESLERNGTPRPADLDSWLNQNPPKNASTYRGVEASVVKPPEKSG